MKKLIAIAFVVFLSVALFQSCNEPLVNENETPELKSADASVKCYIVVLNDAELNAELAKLKGYEKKQEAVKAVSAKLLKRAGITDGEVEHVYGTALQGFSLKIPPGQLKKLQDDPSVSYIEEDQVIYLIQPDIKINGKPQPTPPSESIPWGIARVKGGVSGASGKAWVIDSGIDLDHPDLNVDKANSKDFTGSRNGAEDENGHGTHVAGTIAAIAGNGIGVVGVAAGAKVVAVRVLDRRGSGYNSWVIAGVDYVAANAASGDVANMSLGGGISTTLDAAVLNASTYSNKNIYFALAAGNESDDANNHSPARANGPNIYTISAMDIKDNWASFSNYGNPPIEFCEPGYSIFSTYKGGAYATMSGTSMAAPHAAGILLLGSIKNGGTVSGDPDGNPDVIGIH